MQSLAKDAAALRLLFRRGWISAMQIHRSRNRRPIALSAYPSIVVKLVKSLFQLNRCPRIWFRR